MKIKYLLIYPLIISSGNLIARDVNTGNDVQANPLIQGYVLESLNSGGFTNSTINTVFNITSSNPASMVDFNKITISGSIQYESDITPVYYIDMSHNRYQNNLPQSMSFIYPFKNYRLGLGMSQKYNSILDLGEFQRTTIEHPEGIGETYTAKKRTTIISYSALFAYAFKNCINNNDHMNVGILLSYNQLEFLEEIYHCKADAKTNTFSFHVGFRYDFPQIVKLGMFFEKGSYFKDKIRMEGQDELLTQIDIDPDLTGNNPNINEALSSEPFNLIGKTPDRLHFGILIELSSKLSMTLDLTQIYWRQIEENSKNNIDIAGSLHYHLFESITLTTGFLSTNRKYDEDNSTYFMVDDELYGLYIMGGIHIHLPHFEIDIAHAGTHTSSGEWRKQTISKIGISLYF